MTQDHDTKLNWQVAIEDPPSNKSELRMLMRQRLRDCDKDSSELLSSLEASLSGLKGSKIIAIYAAMADEPRIHSLIESLPQHRWLLPRVDGDHLDFHRVWDPSLQLKTGAFGIQEPDSSLPATACHDIDIFVCPGLAFDEQGGRLGRGRGFYDRLLANAREDALKIGVGFSCQLVDEIFAEPHDISMNAILCHG